MGSRMASNDPAARVLLTGTAPNGDRVDLVAYGGGRCGISVNGVPDPSRQWAKCVVEESMRELMRALELE